LRKRALELLKKVRRESGKVVVNLGGTGLGDSDPKGAINVNNLRASAPTDPVKAQEAIENLLIADAQDIGAILPSNSVDQIVSYNVNPTHVKWGPTARGAKEILKPGGTVSIAELGGSGEDVMAALREAGFEAVESQFGLVTARKPR
jgi:hypothetical protein